MDGVVEQLERALHFGERRVVHGDPVERVRADRLPDRFARPRRGLERDDLRVRVERFEEQDRHPDIAAAVEDHRPRIVRLEPVLAFGEHLAIQVAHPLGFEVPQPEAGDVRPTRPRGIATAQQLVHRVRAIRAPRRGATRTQRGERAEAAIPDRVVEERPPEGHVVARRTSR
jgi:hypothetical protein